MNPAVMGGVVIILFLVCVICVVAGGLTLVVVENQIAAVPTAKPLSDSNPPVAVNPPGNVSIGSLAPDFELTTPGGQTIRLSDLRGRALLINFWATWCGYCLEEMPIMQQYSNLYGSEIAILALNEGESQTDVSHFISSYGYTFTFLMDQDYRIGDAYRVDGYPITFFVDAAGIIRHRVDGAMGEQDMLNGLSAIGVSR
jgi:thiol-disulfide isomerase/thioredoxin